MKYLLLLFISISALASTEWVTGTTKKSLTPVGNLGYVSTSCLNECKLKKEVKANKSKLRGMKIEGGKDPASVFCKLIGADVIYMAYKENEDTFCVSG